jgi:hypothetical protein
VLSVVVGSGVSGVGCSVEVSSGSAAWPFSLRSSGLIAATIVLNSSMLSRGILVPDFVNPVYPSEFVNSRIVSPTFPPKSSILITISVSAFFFILPISFSIVDLSVFDI